MVIVPFSLGALSQEGVRPLGSADISADLPLPWFVIMVMSLIGDLDNYDHERFYVPDPIAPLLWAFLVANIFDICKNYHKHQDRTLLWWHLWYLQNYHKHQDHTLLWWHLWPARLASFPPPFVNLASIGDGAGVLNVSWWLSWGLLTMITMMMMMAMLMLAWMMKVPWIVLLKNALQASHEDTP